MLASSRWIHQGISLLRPPNANRVTGWVQDIHLESENQRTELRKRGQFPLTTDIFEGIKHTYNIAGDFLGYSGHFDDSVIEKVRRHPDVSSSPISAGVQIHISSSAYAICILISMYLETLDLPRKR